MSTHSKLEAARIASHRQAIGQIEGGPRHFADGGGLSQHQEHLMRLGAEIGKSTAQMGPTGLGIGLGAAALGTAAAGVAVMQGLRRKEKEDKIPVSDPDADQ